MTQSPQWQPDPHEQPPGPDPYPPDQGGAANQPTGYGQEQGSPPPYEYRGAAASRMRPDDERNWAMGAHLGSFLAAYVALGLLAPLLVLLLKGNDSPYVRWHAVESLNFQINALVYTVLFALLIFVLIGLVLLPLYGIFYLIVVVLGSVKASQGQYFRYPLTIRFVN